MRPPPRESLTVKDLTRNKPTMKTIWKKFFENKTCPFQSWFCAEEEEIIAKNL